MQKIKCIIIEDEPLATKVINDYISKVPYLELTGCYKEAMSAGNHIQQEQVDLIFLDIHLPELKGLAFLRTLTNPPVVIITTAYHQYAVEGFELNVADYLMKPFSFERFVTAVNKAAKLIKANQSESNSEYTQEQPLFLTIDRKKVRIVFDNILYIESKREYVKIVTSTDEFISKMSTTELETLLPNTKFIRIHRSYIVSVDKIDAFTKGKVEIRGKTIPVGKAYRNELLLHSK